MKLSVHYFTLIAAMLFSGIHSHAQHVYDFSVSQDTYIPLPNALKLNNTNIWDDVNYKVPLGFNYELDWMPVNTFALVCNTKGIFFGVDTTSLFNGFCVLDADLQDRGKVDTISKSTIRHRTDVVDGKKIVKIEFHNAGFWRERDLYNTMDDSLNLQVWMYEGTNALELRYGPSKISHASDYFIYGAGTGPVIGMVKDAGLFSLNLSTLYYLKGNPGSPVFDSCGTSISNVAATLDAYPPSGTVYRFVPKPNSVKRLEPKLMDIIVLNTVCKNELTLINNSTETANYQIISLTGSIFNNTGIINKGQSKIDINQLPAGIYLLQLRNHESVNNIRFVKM